MASRVAVMIALSCRFDPLKRKPSGMPRASMIKWRFKPGLPRSVGSGRWQGQLYDLVGHQCDRLDRRNVPAGIADARKVPTVVRHRRVG